MKQNSGQWKNKSNTIFLSGIFFFLFFASCHSNTYRECKESNLYWNSIAMVERINFSSDLNGAKFNDSIYFSLIVSWDSICIPDCIADVPNSTFYNSPFQNDILIVNGDSLNLITVVSSKNRMSNYVELRIPTYSCLKSDTETMKLYCNNIMNHGELLHMESYGKLKEISKSTSFDILYIRSAFEHDFFEIKTFPPWEKFPKFITFE